MIEAVETAGRSVLIAGMTVLISVNGLFLMGVGYLRGVALATSLAVLAVMAAARDAAAGAAVDRRRAASTACASPASAVRTARPRPAGRAPCSVARRSRSSSRSP